MSYQVLARKYRPRTFEQMVGQEHVLRALVNALDQNRLHHAYLFTGTRGVGKTSLARLLAKCLNCETGVTSKPCEICSSCQEINEGRFVDLLEIDAASRTKVEDTRELLENVQYAPTRGRYKVYLIDEVHMLSGHSFNALLKTLEEPPAHVKFLLATTDPQKLPVTILSRCLQFNLKNLQPEQISNHLEAVLNKEAISFEAPAIKQLARAANGSLRDALSLLDQSIAFGGGKVIAAEVNAMLGSIEQKHIFALLEALISNSAKEILNIIAQLTEQAAEFAQVLEEFISLLHRIAIMQVVPDAIDEDKERISQYAQHISKEDLHLYYQIGLIGRRDLPLAPTARSGFEMVMLRMIAFRPEEITEKFNKEEPVKITSMSTGSRLPSRDDALIKPQQTAPVRTQQTTFAQEADINWPEIATKLNLTGFAQALAMNCALKDFANDQINLLLDPIQTALRNPKQEARLAEALCAYFGKPITVQISVGTAELATPARINQKQQSAQLNAAKQALENDTNVQAILKTFGATMQPHSIQTKEST